MHTVQCWLLLLDSLVPCLQTRPQSASQNSAPAKVTHKLLIKSFHTQHQKLETWLLSCIFQLPAQLQLWNCFPWKKAMAHCVFEIQVKQIPKNVGARSTWLESSTAQSTLKFRASSELVSRHWHNFRVQPHKQLKGDQEIWVLEYYINS